MQWDALLWQVPALSLAAQAFLLNVALAADSSRFSRLVCSGLAVVAAVLSLPLLLRHRQAEVTDAHWLAAYEAQHFDTVAHGPAWRDQRNDTILRDRLGFLGRVPALPVWQAGLSLFGLAALAVFLLAIFHVQTLR